VGFSSSIWTERTRGLLLAVAREAALLPALETATGLSVFFLLPFSGRLSNRGAGIYRVVISWREVGSSRIGARVGATLAFSCYWCVSKRIALGVDSDFVPQYLPVLLRSPIPVFVSLARFAAGVVPLSTIAQFRIVFCRCTHMPHFWGRPLANVRKLVGSSDAMRKPFEIGDILVHASFRHFQRLQFV